MSEEFKWPEPISDSGLYGIAGEFVHLVEQHTEGDRNAILLTFLTYAGNFLGREHYMQTGSDRQCANLYLCIVGPTAGGRKGSAVSAAETFFTQGPQPPRLPKIVYGISSGEGVIHQIRNPKTKRELNRKTNAIEEVTIDEGVTDKRVLFNLSEFQQCVVNMRRQDSILGSIIRQAWDKGSIASPSKNNEVVSSAAHISIVAATSQDELLEQVYHVDAQNGTLNRFLFACAQRSKYLPEGGKFEDLYQSPQWSDLQNRFYKNIHDATHGSELHLKRQSDTQDDWGRNLYSNRGLYKKLSEPRIGLWGSVTARTPQQVIRLSLISAIINGHTHMENPDQQAAAEYWRYCDDSAKYIFGDRLEDMRAAKILQTLRELPNGMTKRQMYETWRHDPKEDLDASLTLLEKVGLAYRRMEQTGGRPTERWFATL